MRVIKYSCILDISSCLDIKWLHGDALSLPFPSNHFDGYTIAFGIRNVSNFEKVQHSNNTMNSSCHSLLSSPRLYLKLIGSLKQEAGTCVWSSAVLRIHF